MASEGIRQLADALMSQGADVGINVLQLWATVVGMTYTGGHPTLTIHLNGIDVPGVRYAASYSPTIGDTVYGRIVGTDMLVEGKRA